MSDDSFGPRGGEASRGTFVGTPLYVAPEMLEDNRSGPYTDIWALGCTLFEMLAGRTPFEAETGY